MQVESRTAMRADRGRLGLGVQMAAHGLHRSDPTVMTMAPPVVAVFNTSPDVVELLRTAFEQAGLVTVSAFTYELRDGHVDLESFIAQHDPRVIVYDVAPPYEENWRLFQHVSTRPVMRGRAFVLTTTNALQLEKLAGSHTPLFEIVGKPFDLDRLTRAVKEASRSRPTS